MKTLVAAALLAFVFASTTAFAFELSTQPQPVKVDHGDDVK